MFNDSVLNSKNVSNYFHDNCFQMIPNSYGRSNFDSLDSSQMLRHVISDAHERINAVTSVVAT